MRLPRCRIRTLMVSVVIVALTLAALNLLQKRNMFALEAEKNARMAAYYESKQRSASANYYREKSMRSARAARQRWLSVAPDPPPPN